MPGVMECLQVLASVLACGLIPFAMVGYPCCCTPDTCRDAACTACKPDVAGGGPPQYEVVVSGFANNVCTGCSAIDGTFTLDYDGSVLNICRWYYETTSGCVFQAFGCSTGCTKLIEIGVADNSGLGDNSAVSVTVLVKRQGFSDYDAYESSDQDSPDCCAYVDEATTHVASAGTSCDGTGATVTFSAIP